MQPWHRAGTTKGWGLASGQRGGAAAPTASSAGHGSWAMLGPDTGEGRDEGSVPRSSLSSHLQPAAVLSAPGLFCPFFWIARSFFHGM